MALTLPGMPTTEEDAAVKESDAGKCAVCTAEAEDDDDDCSTPRQVHEELGEIKARAMYRMVEDIQVGSQVVKLLFLTNKQATLLAEVPGSAERIMDALEVKKPKLVIRFLQSLGSIGWCKAAQEDDFDASEGWHPAWFTLSWASAPEGHEADRRLERFMSEVMLPLAVETNAVILCEALRNTCMLTDAFCNAMSLCKSRWAGSQIPFTLIGFTCELDGLYRNNETVAFWRTLRRKSPTWREREPHVLKAVNLEVTEHGMDLNPHILHFVIGDSLDERRGVLGEYAPFAMFSAHMALHLTQRLPGICLKTGMGSCILGDGSSWHVALEALESGVPLVLLDLRERPRFEASTREELIELAWSSYLEGCGAISSSGTRDSLDVMALGHFYEVLYGDGNPLSTCVQDLSDDAQLVPLYRAIELNQKHMQASKAGFGLTPASGQQTHALLSRFAHHLYAEAEARLAEQDASALAKLRSASGEGLFYLGGTMHEYLRQVSHLIAHDRVHAANVMDIPGARRLVGQLARLDRIPAHDVLEGLILLREAWDEYDVAMYLAGRYKWLSKSLYAAALLVGICTVLFTVLREEAVIGQFCESAEGWLNDGICGEPLGLRGVPPKSLSYALFAFSLAAGVLCSVSALLNPSERWRQLRSSACALRSTIWLYRARVGAFATSPVNRLAAQQTFSAFLQQWREELVAGTDLQSSSMGRKHTPRVFQHMQRASSPAQLGPDDFHSPVKPHGYIGLRLRPAMDFFQQRIPTSANERFAMQILLMVCSVVGALFTQLEGRWPSYVALVSTAGGALTSWLEFVDLGRKVERYTSTVRRLKNLLSWWATLDGVAQVNLSNIEHLVTTGESILSSEFRAWSSTGGSLALRSGTTTGSEGGEEDAGGAGGILPQISVDKPARRIYAKRPTI